MPAADPPADLSGFPRTSIASATACYRVVLAHDPVTEEPRTPWFFSSAGSPTSGRFDLPAPQGSCYLSDRRYGAWLEVFRAAGLVDAVDVERRRLVTAVRSTPLRALANLRAAAARAFGATADLFAGDDYTRSQAWAVALRRAGFAGLASALRHDPTGKARTVTVFGTAGPRHIVRGWRTTVSPLTRDVALLTELARFGTGVAARPYDVVVIAPPARET